MTRDHRRDHLADRQHLARTATHVPRREPVEAEVAVVLALLLRKQHRETVAVGHVRPAGAQIIAGRGLGAAVQDDDERGIGGERRGDVDIAVQRAGVGAERIKPRQAAAVGRQPHVHRAGAAQCGEPANRIGNLSHRPRPHQEPWHRDGLCDLAALHKRWGAGGLLQR